MTGIIILTTAGADIGPFNLYSNIDGYTSAFAVGITRTQLLAGFATDLIPNGSTSVKLVSTGICNTTLVVVLPPITCYRFLPAGGSYMTSIVFNPTTSYFYGYFTGYEETGIPTTNKHLIRLNEDLTIDDAFVVGTGFNEILYVGSSIITQPDGKILVTGTFITYQGVSARRIIRLNTDGSRDNTFVIGTGFSDFTQSVGIDSNNSIIVTGIFGSYNGTSSPRIARLLSNGTIDPTFIVGAGFNNTTTGLLINSDNSMIVSGYFSTYKGVACGNGITKLDSTGNVDPTFNVGSGLNPYVANNASYMTRIAGESSFYIAGYFTSYKGVAANRIEKIDSLGNKDVSFNAGTGFNSNTSYIGTVWENKIFVSGSFTTYNGTTARRFIVLNADGTIAFAPSIQYDTPIIIGNTLFAALPGDCLKPIYINS